MLGLAQMFALEGREPTRKEREEFARVVTETGSYLLGVVNNVLDLELVEAGSLRVELGPVPLPALLAECEGEIAPQAARRSLRLAFRSTEEFTVLADRARLKQVLMILLSNGVKYNRDGGLLLVACVRGASGRVRISVEDNGRGLSAQQIGQLFQPFKPLGYVRGRLQGPGIGLALARSLVELMGGQVGVTSTEGAGSAFWIDLASAPMTGAAPLKDSARARGG
jgi:signal transduction histidine kinase